MPTKIVILGAGYAGVEAALTLYKKKDKKEELEITLIDKNSYHTLLTELHEVAGNRISDEGVIVPLRDIFRYTDVRLVQDEITSLDLDNNRILSETNEYQYDYLILAAGSQPNFYGIEGMKEHAFTLWSFGDALRIKRHIIDCFVKASQEKDREKRSSLLTFVVGGGGFTGVEMIGELAQWTKSLCVDYGIPKEEVKLILVEALPKILENLPDKSIEKSMKYLTRKLRVEVLTNSPITKLDGEFLTLGNGNTIKTKTLIWTAGIKATSLCDTVSCDKNKACRIVVDKYAQTEKKNVYAVGDLAAFKVDNATLPALVETALQTGKGAALNILNDIRGKEKVELKPKLHGVMVSIGSYFAVSDIMGKQYPRFISLLLKYLVNVHYLFGIGGFELVIRYLKHELLEKKQKKTIIERHWSVMTPSFWLVPIRLFLGYSWLAEGWAKVKEGWFTDKLLAGLAAADAGSSASTSETGEKVFRIITETTPSWYAWIADNIVIPNAMLFQWLIVLAEIGIGLALISGTFTFIAALGGLALNINFILSTGLYEYNWWYIPAALCLLGGAGRAFGVDYYLIPYLMRQWRYFTRNRGIKLFLWR